MSENNVLATYFGEGNEVTWKDDEEKGLFWFYDDLHCPNPISPLYFDIGGWWGQSCEYMYRRFGAPIGSEWIAKKIGGYVYSAVVPPKTDADKVGALFEYYTQVMPIYADTFLDRWNKEYVPELEAAGKKIVGFDFSNATIPECLIHMEDCIDLQDRAFRIHWIINLAQFQASSAFAAMPCIDGHFDTQVTRMGQFEASYQSFHSMMNFFGLNQLLCGVHGLAMPVIDTDEIRRQHRAKFCAEFAAGRPYFMIRAKTPQILFDEIEKIMESTF